MTNGDTVLEIKSLLAEGDGAMSTKTALRLSLNLQIQIFERQAEQEKKHKELEGRLKKQEDTNIILWVQNNPKLSLFAISVYLIIASLIDFRDVIAKAIGLR
jgi:hypothetical protein